jgi:hypothetical protein
MTALVSANRTSATVQPSSEAMIGWGSRAASASRMRRWCAMGASIGRRCAGVQPARYQACRHAAEQKRRVERRASIGSPQARQADATSARACARMADLACVKRLRATAWAVTLTAARWTSISLSASLWRGLIVIGQAPG